ncbi:MAG: DegT/DnrJ/EryC1/StrS family aminotransferase [Bacteroidia bacterium]
MKDKIWLSSPHIGEAEKEFVTEAFETNWIAPLGPHVNGFEKDLETYNQVGFAAALSSGTAALHLALILCDVKPGDVVLCQSFTFCGSANPILYTGATPVFIDSEPGSWNMDPVQLENAIVKINNGDLKGVAANARIRAIIPVNLYGMPARLNEIIEIGNKYNIPVIEDAAESLGSTYQGKKTGSFGDFGIYSFNGNKIITTSGGGALVSADEALIKKSRFLATQARDEAPHYQHSEVGYNYRLSNVLAGIGRGQMQVLDARIAKRRENFSRYKSYFNKWNDSGFNIQFQEEAEGSFSNRWLTCILIEPKENKGMTRDEVRLTLEKENVEARPLWKPMHMQPLFQAYPFFGSGVAEHLFDIGLCLPSGSNLSEDDFQRIFEVLDKLVER